MQVSSSMPSSRRCMTADPFKGAAWCITATGACKLDSNGHRNTLKGGSCDEEAQAAFGSVWSGAIVLTRSPDGGRTR